PEQLRFTKRPDDIYILNSLKEFIQKIAREGYSIGSFCLHGAEPAMMRPESIGQAINLVINHWDNNGCAGRGVAMQTNGVRLTPEYLTIITNEIPDKKYFRPGFSIDPPRAVHDFLRNNSWAKAVNNYEAALDMGFPASVLSVVSSMTIEHKNEFADWMEKQIDRSKRFGNPYRVKIKLATGELAPREDQQLELAQLLLERGLAGLVQMLSPGYCLSAGNECEWYEFDSCGGCYSCNKTFMPGRSFADWRSDSFGEIIALRKSLYINELTHPDCGDCDYEIICNSGCPADRYQTGAMAGKAHECTMIKYILDEIQKDGTHLADFINNN
ncbi:MAG: hypothetical protein ACLFQX_04620, partial [Candidatus Kapaibacterium sp.]